MMPHQSSWSSGRVPCLATKPARDGACFLMSPPLSTLVEAGQRHGQGNRVRWAQGPAQRAYRRGAVPGQARSAEAPEPPHRGPAPGPPGIFMASVKCECPRPWLAPSSALTFGTHPRHKSESKPPPRFRRDCCRPQRSLPLAPSLREKYSAGVGGRQAPHASSRKDLAKPPLLHRRQPLHRREPPHRLGRLTVWGAWPTDPAGAPRSALPPARGASGRSRHGCPMSALAESRALPRPADG